MKYWKIVLLFFLLLGISGPITAEDELPEGSAIFEMYVEAMGGKAAFDKISNRVMKGNMEPKGSGMKLPMEIYQAKPNKNYTLIDMGQMGKNEKGSDGTIVWELSPMTGPTIYKGRQKADFLREAILDKWVHWRLIYKKVECTGMADVEGKACYKVLTTLKNGEKKPEGESKEKPRTQTLYFDKETHLVSRVDLMIENPMGSMTAEVYILDYKKVGDIALAHKMVMKAMGQELVTTFETIENNVELPTDRFDLPEEIRTLLDEEKKESEEKENP